VRNVKTASALLLAELQASEHDKFAAYLYRSRLCPTLARDSCPHSLSSSSCQFSVTCLGNFRRVLCIFVTLPLVKAPTLCHDTLSFQTLRL
jgi:hypothetical protein